MSDKKEPSIEELIELAQQAKSTVAPKDRLSEVEQFIKDLEVESGEEKVDSQNIYWCYRIWCRDLGKRPKNGFVFLKEFGRYFERYTNGKDGVKYLVKAEPFLLSENDWWDMRKYYRNRREIWKRNREKKADKAKPS